jgi:hypothetical protein
MNSTGLCKACPGCSKAIAAGGNLPQSAEDTANQKIKKKTPLEPLPITFKKADLITIRLTTSLSFG